MFKAIKRWWKYLTAKVNSSFNEKADPKIQLEQAIMEAQEQHRRLKEQAANVIANQKQTELRLNRSLEELEKLNGNARQAVLMADEAQKKGDATKATEYTTAAESFANRLIQLEARDRGAQGDAPAGDPGRRIRPSTRSSRTRPRSRRSCRSASASSASSTRRRWPSR